MGFKDLVKTDKILKEYCLINIENLKSRILMLTMQVKNIDREDPALKISEELLLKSENDLVLYLNELKYLG